MAFGSHVTFHAETTLFADRRLRRSTPYQRIVVTGNDNFALWFNGALQFSSADEYRYHEALSMDGARGAAAALSWAEAITAVPRRQAQGRRRSRHDIDPAMTGSRASRAAAARSGHAWPTPRDRGQR
jgi:spermidine synthase